MSSNTPTSTRDEDQKRSDEMTNFVRNMLDQMEMEFNEAGNNMLGRMDEVGKKLDDLERSISDLMTDAGLEAKTIASPTVSAHGQATPQASPTKTTTAVL